MNSETQRIKALPTNIVTGFLGVGKTTAILHLLKQKPQNERWAVLVNEFGEVGVDGSFYEAQSSTQNGVYIREIPGGCMCCAAGLPMQIALNQLLTRANPDRLLIEPTGLGHPKEVLQVLSSPFYAEVLDIQKNITLVDARKCADARYTEHPTFNQQIDIADVIVGNKEDLYQKQDKDNLLAYIAQRKAIVMGTTQAATTKSPAVISPAETVVRETPVTFTQHGQMDIALLAGPSLVTQNLAFSSHVHDHPAEVSTVDEPIPDCGFVRVQNKGEGFQSVGWRFSPEIIFSRKKLYLWLSGLVIERMKAVFITQDGVFAYNSTGETLTELELDDSLESRIEIIAPSIEESWNQDLLNIAGL